ncbi:MAG: hypothetical protein D6824_10060 [Planctomycetota bacterium]|nr:MAG: hypothetical protein D6824_10060 [Planctomycetota bacterium]
MASQISMEQWREATRVWGALSADQRARVCRAARAPMCAVMMPAEWAAWWPEIKGGLVWCGYDPRRLAVVAGGAA